MEHALRFCQCVFVFAALFASVAGCAADSSQAELDFAKASVTAALDAWKNHTSTATVSATPGIDFHDDDHKRSARLVEYTVQPPYLETDGTARCPVELVIQQGKGRPERRRVTYQVLHKDDKAVIAPDPFS